jgi:hypothetical protein
LPEDGWMMTMLAARRKSCVQKQLSGIDHDELSVYLLTVSISVLLSLDGSGAVVVVVVMWVVWVDLRLERSDIGGVRACCVALRMYVLEEKIV